MGMFSKVLNMLRGDVLKTHAANTARKALAGVAAQKAIRKMSKTKITEKDVKDILKAYGHESEPFALHSKMYAKGEWPSEGVLKINDTGKLNPNYVPRIYGDLIGNTVNVGEKTHKAFLAHELAHATSPMLKTKAGQLAYIAGAKLAPAVQNMYLMAKVSKGETIPKKKLALFSLAQLPVLLEETRANWKAGKYMWKSTKGGLKEKLKAVSPLLVSQASYLHDAASPFLDAATAKILTKKK